MDKETKWLIGSIVAAVIVTGIGVGAVVSSLVGHQVAHVWNAMRDHEQRVNDSNSRVILELQMLLRPLQDDHREQMGDVEGKLSRIRRSLDALRDSSRGTTHGVVEGLQRIKHELTALSRDIEARAPAVAAATPGVAETLEGIRRQLTEIERRLSALDAEGEGEKQSTGQESEPDTEELAEESEPDAGEREGLQP